MPEGIGYPNKKRRTRSELTRAAKEKKSAGNVLGAVGSSLKAAALRQMSPAAKKRQEHLRQRAITEQVTGRRRGGGTTAQPTGPPQPPPSGGLGESIREGSGLGRLTGVLTPKPPKKRRQR